jgi:hypothetical protein
MARLMARWIWAASGSLAARSMVILKASLMIAMVQYFYQVLVLFYGPDAAHSPLTE